MKRLQTTWAMPLRNETVWRPLAHVALRDTNERTRISEALRAEGWAVVDSKSGYHLLQSLSGPLVGDQPWCRPGLVVVDAFSPGCSGLSIAQGLRSLGWQVKTVLISNGVGHPFFDDSEQEDIYIAGTQVALQTVLEVARGVQDRRDQRVVAFGEGSETDPDCIDADEDEELELASTGFFSTDNRALA